MSERAADASTLRRPVSSVGVGGLQEAGAFPAPKPARNLRLDALRGALLVVMTLDHFPSGITPLTKESLGYVSAAEGFVFLSGFLAGMVYRRYAADRSVLWQKVARRFGYIYLFHIAVFLLVLGGIGIFGVDRLSWREAAPLMYSHPWRALAEGLTLLYRPVYLDILPMYCVLVLLIPLVVRPGARPWWAVLFLSACVWLVAQFNLSSKLPGWFPFFAAGQGSESFDILAWQFLFVSGLVFGAYADVLVPVFKRSGRNFFVASIFVVLLLFLARHRLFEGAYLYRLELLADRRHLGPLRLLDFTAIVLVLCRIRPPPGAAPVLRGFAYLGRNSLQVYSFHVLTLYLFLEFFVSPQFRSESRNILLAPLCVAVLYLAAWCCETLRRRSFAARVRGA